MLLGLAQGCCSSPPCHSPMAPCLNHGALLGATGLLLGCTLGTGKEQQPCQGSTTPCQCMLDVPSLQQHCPAFPGSRGVLSWQAASRTMESPLEQVPIQDQPHRAGIQSTLLSPAWEAAPQGTGTQDGHCRDGAAQGSLEGLWAEHAPSRSTPRTAPPPQCHVASSWNVWMQL